jgi:hypothetical protein
MFAKPPAFSRSLIFATYALFGLHTAGAEVDCPTVKIDTANSSAEFQLSDTQSQQAIYTFSGACGLRRLPADITEVLLDAESGVLQIPREDSEGCVYLVISPRELPSVAVTDLPLLESEAEGAKGASPFASEQEEVPMVANNFSDLHGGEMVCSFRYHDGAVF